MSIKNGRGIIKDIAVLLLVICFVISPHEKTKALNNQLFLLNNNNPEECIFADIVIIFDNSQVAANLDYQRDAIRFLTNQLAYGSSQNCSENGNRLGLVGLSNPDDEQLSLRQFIIDPNATVIEKDNYINQLLSPIIEGNTDRGGVNLASALIKAEEMLSTAPSLGSANRKQLLFLILDKQATPCKDDYCAEYLIPIDQTYINSIISNFDSGISFSVIGLSKNDGPFGGSTFQNILDSYKKFWEKNTKTHNGKFILIRNNDNSLPSFLVDEFITQIGTSNIQKVCGAIEINPFINTFSLNVYSQDQIVDPKIKPLSGDTPLIEDYSPSSDNAKFYLSHLPIAGRWTFQFNCDSNKAVVYSFIENPTKLKLVEPQGVLPQYEANSEMFDPESPFYLKFYISDDFGKQLKGMNGFIPTFDAYITLPNQQKIVLPITVVEDHMEGTNPLPTNMVGTYEISVSVTLPSSIDGQPPRPQVKQVFQYFVENRIPFTYEVSAPVQNSRIPIHGNLFNKFMQVKPVDIKITLKPVRQQDDSSVFSDFRTGDSSKDFRVVLLAPDQTSQEVWLTPSPTEPFTYIGTVGEKTDQSGVYSLGISYSKSYDSKNYFFSTKPEIETITFTRKDGVFELPLTYNIILVILLLIALYFLLLWIWNNTNHSIGFLLFSPPSDDFPPFHKIEISAYKRRTVVLDAFELKSQNVILQRLERIKISSPEIFGNKQVIEVTELDNYPVQSVVDKLNENKEIYRTADKTGSYTIKFVSTIPKSELGEVKNFISSEGDVDL